MSSLLNTRDRFFVRAALTILLLASLGAAFAAVMHWFEPDPHVINLIAPLFISLSCLALLVRLYWRPDNLRAVLLIGIGLVVLSIGVVSWFFLLQAIASKEALVDIYPPIASALLPAVLSMFLVLRPRVVLYAAAAVWMIIDVPVLAYLAYHPAELWSSRGMDILITIGPSMMIVLMLIPFLQGVERQFVVMQNEQVRTQSLAERDVLTGLYNRRAAEAILSELSNAPQSPVGVIFFDIDRFKAINDKHGHGIGDKVLREVSRRCAERLRGSDIFVRWGGEEFLVLIHGGDEAATNRLAEDLRRAIRAWPIDPTGTVTASFGVTQWRDQDSVDELLKRADEALYAAKDSGRDRAVCH